LEWEVLEIVWGKIFLANVFKQSVFSFSLSLLRGRGVVGHVLCNISVVRHVL